MNHLRNITLEAYGSIPLISEQMVKHEQKHIYVRHSSVGAKLTEHASNLDSSSHETSGLLLRTLTML